MKKIYALVLTAALLLAGTRANAQLMIGAGYLNSAETSSYTNSNSVKKMGLNGFYAGISYNIPIVAGLGIAPGVYASMLFGKTEDSGNIIGINFSGSSKYQEMTINAPVNLNFAYKLNRDTKIFVYAGPVFQYGLSSTYTEDAKASVAGVTLSGDPTVYDNYKGDNPSRKPFNIYVGGGAGLQAGSMQIILGYDQSVTNISAKDNTQISRSQIKVGFGLAF